MYVQIVREAGPTAHTHPSRTREASTSQVFCVWKEFQSVVKSQQTYASEYIVSHLLCLTLYLTRLRVFNMFAKTAIK